MHLTHSSVLPGPKVLYERDLQQGVISPDPHQLAAVEELEIRYHQLLGRRAVASGWRRWVGRLRASVQPRAAEPGLYLWGGVGRGKTYLMDLFFHALPGSRKLRMHFHRFMRMVHQRLQEASGLPNPLEHVARTLAQEVDVICFDEFFVSDIGDAMILGNLLETLFEEGVMLVATSNIVPDRLYERGLQRQMFLPAIALLNRHTRVMHLDGDLDYRLRSLDRVPVYLSPIGPEGEAAMEALFLDLSRGLHVESGKALEIEGRLLPTLRWAEGLVWFDFATLCRGARGAADYIELSRQFHTVFVSGIPCMGEERDDEARRFVTLVDELYDRRVKLVVLAEAGPEALYQGRELRFPFQRTASRLLEMQTRDYLAGAHRPD
ncbi:MAG TPA: cell division protein ZapE [Pseudomonadaceae bacterium]|nr:cell division protein ZapE [Pseudomonadaceae bacterium]